MAAQDDRRKVSLLQNVGDSLLKSAYPSTAAHLIPDLLEAAESSKAPLLRSLAFWWVARVEMKRGRASESLRFIERAKIAAADIPADSVREGVLGDILRIEGEILIQPDPARAVSVLDQAMEMAEKRDNQVRLIELLAFRSQALERSGRHEKATADLERGLILAEKQQENLTSSSDREAFSRSVRPLCAAQIRLAADQDRAIPSLLALQRCQALSQGFPFTPSAEDLRDLQVSLGGKDKLVIQYFLDSSHLYIWGISAFDVRFFQLPVEIDRLQEDIDRLALWLDYQIGDPQRFTDLSSSLYERLLGSLRQDLGKFEEIILVPDSFLFKVPFSVLIDSDQRPLIETHRVTIALSTAGLQAGTRSKGSRNLSLLAVANPALDRSRYSDLEDLPAASEEVASILPLYEKTRVIRSEEATKAGLIAALKQPVDIFHFAGHALLGSSGSSTRHPRISSGNSMKGMVHLLFAGEMESGKKSYSNRSAESAFGSEPSRKSFGNRSRYFRCPGLPTTGRKSGHSYC